jgi:hypothetical protein
MIIINKQMSQTINSEGESMELTYDYSQYPPRPPPQTENEN